MEGPYFVDERLNRSDIRSDPLTGEVKEGALLHLLFAVSQITGSECTALQGAMVDVWHCDAMGIYSDVPAQGSDGQMFLRGFQMTNASGVARFLTIYPGWYPGRTAHIHVKIRVDDGSGGTYDFTSQLYFRDALTAQIYTHEPYAAHGPKDTANREDFIFRNGGDQLMLRLTRTDAGFVTLFNIGLDLT
jgi:protocatechuate 3,4-dioxygenase beta subunit